MTAIDNTPSNKNFLSPLNFKFQIKKAPHVNFFIQKVNIPSISIETNPSPNNPFVKTPIPGEHISYSDLSISFKVDEDLTNYMELHNWIKALGKPQNFEQFKPHDAEYGSNNSHTRLNDVEFAEVKCPA